MTDRLKSLWSQPAVTKFLCIVNTQLWRELSFSHPTKWLIPDTSRTDDSLGKVCCVSILVTVESYDEMQQTLPEAVIGKTCNDLVARCFLKPIISQSAPSHIRSTIRKFCCLSVVCGPSIWYDTEICGHGVNYILHSHGRWVSLYPPRVTVSFKWYQPSANASGWYHLKLTVTLGGYNDQYPPRVTVSFKWYSLSP